MRIDTANPRNGATGLRVCALLLVSLLLLEPAAPLHAQADAAAPPRSLQIMILDGEGALNNIQQRTAREPIVQVQDENHKPVAGALVLFTIHGSGAGAGGTFADGLTTLSVTTGPDGRAQARGLMHNQNEGAWQVAVTATYGSLAASTLINQINFVPLPPAPTNYENRPGPAAPTHWFLSKPVLLIGGAIVCGAVIAVVVIQGTGSGTQINAGAPSVGAPTAAASGLRVSFGKH